MRGAIICGRLCRYFRSFREHGRAVVPAATGDDACPWTPRGVTDQHRWCWKWRSGVCRCRGDCVIGRGFKNRSWSSAGHTGHLARIIPAALRFNHRPNWAFHHHQGWHPGLTRRRPGLDAKYARLGLSAMQSNNRRSNRAKARKSCRLQHAALQSGAAADWRDPRVSSL